jgi:hypothetical protein
MGGAQHPARAAADQQAEAQQRQQGGVAGEDRLRGGVVAESSLLLASSKPNSPMPSISSTGPRNRTFLSVSRRLWAAGRGVSRQDRARASAGETFVRKSYKVVLAIFQPTPRR